MQSVSPLEETDASFRTRSPFLSLPKPASLLVPSACGAAARTMRNRDPFHAPLLPWRFLGGGVKSGAGGHQTRQPPQSLLMNLDRRQQQIGIVGPLADLFHRAPPHPHPVAPQGRVSRVVPVGLHHGGVQAQFFPWDGLFLLRHGLPTSSSRPTDCSITTPINRSPIFSTNVAFDPAKPTASTAASVDAFRGIRV